jgi:hypothetical protein
MQITNNYSGSPIHVNGGLGEFDFGNLFGKITEAATTIYAAKTARDVANDEAKRQYELQKLQIQSGGFPSGNYDFLNSPNYSPIYGGGNPSGFPVAPVLILAGLGLAAYLVLRK